MSASPPRRTGATIAVTALTVFNVLAAFAYQMVMASVFGTSRELDAYFAALAIPQILNLVVTGTLNFSLVPGLTDIRENSGEKECWRVASGFAVLVFICMSVMAVVIVLLSTPLAGLVFPGFDEALVGLSSRLLIIQVIAIPFSGLTGVFISYHYVEKRFIWPHIVLVLGLLSSLLTMTLLSPTHGIDAVAYGFTGSNILQMLLLSPILRRRFRPWGQILSGHTRRLLKLQAPLLLGSIYFKLDPLVDRYLASKLPEGSISSLGFGNNIANKLHSISSVGISTTTFPEMATLDTKKHYAELRVYLAGILQKMLFYLIPIGVVVAILGRELVGLFLERGKFMAASTEMVYVSLVCYLGMVIGGALASILGNTFFAMKDMRTPTLIRVFAFTVGLGLKLLFVQFLGYWSIALATSAFYILVMVLDMYFLRRRLGGMMGPQLLHSTGRQALSAAVAAAPVLGLIALEVARVPRIILGAALFFVIYVAMAYYFNMPGVRDFLRGLKRRLGRLLGRG